MKVLLVVDMLKDFIDKDGALYIGETGTVIAQLIIDKVKKEREAGTKIIYICDSHKPNDKEFNRFPEHAVEGTEGSKLIDGLTIELGDIVVQKTRYSGFYNTKLATILAVGYFDGHVAATIDEVEVVGCCTSICVMDTVGGLANRDYNVVINKDLVADFDQAAHAFSLKRMETLYGAVIN